VPSCSSKRQLVPVLVRRVGVRVLDGEQGQGFVGRLAQLLDSLEVGTVRAAEVDAHFRVDGKGMGCDVPRGARLPQGDSRGAGAEACPAHRNQGKLDRQALERALGEYGCIMFTRRPIPLRIMPGKMTSRA